MHPSLLGALILLAQANTALMTGGPTQAVFGVKYFTNSNLRVNNTTVPDAAVNYQTLTNYVSVFGGGGTIKTGDYVHVFRANTKGLVYAISNHAFLVSGQTLPFDVSFNGNVTVNGDLTTYGNQYHYVTETIYSNVVIWLGTNFIDTVRYTTNIIYDFTEYYSLVSTNIITVASEMIFNNSKLTATNAFWVTAPHFRSIKGTNLLANGVWDFTGATVLGLSPNLIFGNTNASAGLVYTNANVVLIGTNIPPTGLQGNGYTNELGTAGGFYIAVTNGLVEAVAYSPVLYSGGNTGLMHDGAWAFALNDLAGDVVGNPASNTVVALQNRTLPTAPPSVGDILRYSPAGWEYAPLTGVVSSIAITNMQLYADGVQFSPESLASDASYVWPDPWRIISLATTNSVAVYRGFAPVFWPQTTNPVLRVWATAPAAVTVTVRVESASIASGAPMPNTYNLLADVPLGVSVASNAYAFSKVASTNVVAGAPYLLRMRPLNNGVVWIMSVTLEAQ